MYHGTMTLIVTAFVRRKAWEGQTRILRPRTGRGGLANLGNHVGQRPAESHVNPAPQPFSFEAEGGEADTNTRVVPLPVQFNHPCLGGIVVGVLGRIF